MKTCPSVGLMLTTETLDCIYGLGRMKAMGLAGNYLQSAALITLLAVPLSGGLNAIAAERVVLKYGVFRESIAVADLKTFAKTGEISSDLQFYLDAARQNPKDFRRILTQPAAVNIVTLDRVLNHPIGNILLDQIGQAIHPPGSVASRQAIRSALVLSASPDNQISLIEVMQNYPTSEVEVEGNQILQLHRQIKEMGKLLQDIHISP